MKKVICMILAAVLCAGALAGCGTAVKKPLPENPAVFTRGEYVPEGEDTGYTVLENDGKVFVPYGTIRPAGPMRDLSYAYGDCLGYVEGDENDRIYALSDGPDGDWIIEAYHGGMMDVPMIYRARGASDIVPESVEPFEDEVEK